MMAYFLNIKYSFLQIQFKNVSIYEIIIPLLVFSFIIIFKFVLPIYVKKRNKKITFIDELLLLTAYVLKSDGSVSKKEIDFVEVYLTKEYGEQTGVKYFNLLQPYLNKNLIITKSLKKLSYEEATPTLVHLLNFLIKITIIDGFLKNSEYKALLTICKGLELPRIRLDSMLAMYNYVKEDYYKQHKNNHKKQSYINKKTLSTKRAYTILEISESATPKEIKKSYRKLVVLYHPDKLIHLDKKFQKGAKEKYQKINDAYELLKMARGFK